jgi:regulatory protein YycH of two-component signal transduction system YycFG
MKYIWSLMIFSCVIFCACNKVNSNNGTFIKLKTGTTTHNGVEFFDVFDSTNYYDLSEKQIYFLTNAFPYQYGGYILFADNSIQHVDVVGSYDMSTNPYEGINQIDTDCNGNNVNFNNTVNITRNDNQVGGFIEGSFSGVFAKCQYLTSCDCYYAHNVSCNFKLIILP